MFPKPLRNFSFTGDPGLGSAESKSENNDDDPLTIAAALHKIDTKALHASVAKEEREKAEKKAKKTAGKQKSEPMTKCVRK